MLEHRTRARVPGAALPRLLARLAGVEPGQQARSPAEVLGDWLDWQRAVALSRALDDAPANRDVSEDPEGAASPVVASDAPAGHVAAGHAATEHAATGHAATEHAATEHTPADRTGARMDEVAAVAAECMRVRGALEEAIADDARDWTLSRYPRAGEDGASAAAGAAAVQHHCQGLQRDMQSATGRLRGELRECLAQCADSPARLAAVDAVMEGLLAPREHALLVPVVPALVARFERLHALDADAEAPANMDPGAWRAGFRDEARQVLTAELDLRFHPIEALLSALRSQRPDA
ncbi:DUF3348 family protein [Luteimonas sp. MJ246]|uniref:DUF3348 family protein n=1 Tax=Luteimonas sp. MJ174 TaxID=3129237 RepID=UPI0031BAF94E